MPEYINNTTQTVQSNQNVILYNKIPCTKGWLIHSNGSGIVTARGKKTYRVEFGANVSIPATETAPAPVSFAIAVNGETIGTSTATVTPANTERLWHLQTTELVTIPCECCQTISVRNISTIPITVDNASVIIS